MKPDKQQLSPAEIAERAHAFMQTEFGQLFLTSLSGIYNDMHHKAEKEDLSIEQKALYVERAAGIKVAIDWMLERKANHDRGLFAKKVTPATTKT